MSIVGIRKFLLINIQTLYPISVVLKSLLVTKMTKTALVILSEGAEEMETVITVDVLRRGGIDVTVAGLTGTDPVVCSRNVVIKPDTSLEKALQKGPYDAVVMPGGLKGAENMAASDAVKNILLEQEKNNRFIGAICAGPIALRSHGIAHGKNLTSHPSVKGRIVDEGKYKYLEDRVVIDDKLVTSRGPGTCFEFALKLVEALEGKEKSDSLVPPMLLKL